MANMRKVIFWGRDDVLGCSVEIFLSAQSDWKIVRMHSQQDDERVVQAVAREKPDVVILQQGDCQRYAGLSMRLIQAFPGLKVITVSLENNKLEVYCKQEINVKNVTDLLKTIQEDDQTSSLGGDSVRRSVL